MMMGKKTWLSVDERKTEDERASLQFRQPLTLEFSHFKLELKSFQKLCYH